MRTKKELTLQNELLSISRFYNNPSITKDFLKKNPQVNINQPDEYGDLALNTAVFQGHEKQVEYLIKKGAKLDQRDSREQSASDKMIIVLSLPFMQQMSYKTGGKEIEKYFKILHILKRSGANFDGSFNWDFDLSGEQRITTLNNTLQALVFSIIALANNDNLLFYVSSVKDLLDINGPTDWRYVEKRPVLAWAVSNSNIETIKCLIEQCGASLEVKDAEEKSLIDVARERKKSSKHSDINEVCQKIIDYLIDLSAKKNNNNNQLTGYPGFFTYKTEEEKLSQARGFNHMP